MSEDDTKKRERGKNFLEEEKQMLLSIVNDFLKIIENKQTDAVNSKQKAKAWESVAEKFNASATTGRRTGQQLKLLYEGMKKQAKKRRADEKVEIYKTGGGRPATNVTPNVIDKQLIAMVGAQIEPLDNPYDSNTSISENIDDVLPLIILTEPYPNLMDTNTIQFTSPTSRQQEKEDGPSCSSSPVALDKKARTPCSSSAQIEQPQKQAKASWKKNSTASSKVTFIRNARKRNMKNFIEEDPILLMKQERHNKKMKILEIIEEREKIELELKKMELKKQKDMSEFI